MTSELKKIVCWAEGERCHGCDHYHGKAPVCRYAPDTTSLDPADPTTPPVESSDSKPDWLTVPDPGESVNTSIDSKAPSVNEDVDGELARLERGLNWLKKEWEKSARGLLAAGDRAGAENMELRCADLYVVMSRAKTDTLTSDSGGNVTDEAENDG